MSVYLAKVQQGLKVLTSLYLCLCLSSLFWVFGGGVGELSISYCTQSIIKRTTCVINLPLNHCTC